MFEVGKTYIENHKDITYEAPETITVIKPEWIGSPPNIPEVTYLFGFQNNALADEEWKLNLQSVHQYTEEDFQKNWAEAVWDTNGVDPYWRAKHPDE